jgi:hypothetical protein
MRTCDLCDKPPSARGLCNKHYLAAKREGLKPAERRKRYKPSEVEEWARAGRNPDCIDCGDRPLFGGLRCLPCFQVRCEERSAYKARVNA